jgi:hypothetical protein
MERIRENEEALREAIVGGRFLALLAPELPVRSAPIRYALATNKKITPDQRRQPRDHRRQVTYESPLDDLLDVSRTRARAN